MPLRRKFRFAGPALNRISIFVIPCITMEMLLCLIELLNKTSITGGVVLNSFSIKFCMRIINNCRIKLDDFIRKPCCIAIYQVADKTIFTVNGQLLL